MRRKIAVILSGCFVFAMWAPVARADVIETVTAKAEGKLPASVTVTLNDPQTEHGLLKLCLTSHTAGPLACIRV